MGELSRLPHAVPNGSIGLDSQGRRFAPLDCVPLVVSNTQHQCIPHAVAARRFQDNKVGLYLAAAPNGNTGRILPRVELVGLR